MERSDFINKLYESELYKLVVEAEDAMDVHYTIGKILDKIEELGMKPPQVDGDKGQYLLCKYIDPNFNYWDEDFDEQEPEYKAKSQKKKRSVSEIINRDK